MAKTHTQCNCLFYDLLNSCLHPRSPADLFSSVATHKAWVWGTVKVPTAHFSFKVLYVQPTEAKYVQFYLMIFFFHQVQSNVVVNCCLGNGLLSLTLHHWSSFVLFDSKELVCFTGMCTYFVHLLCTHNPTWIHRCANIHLQVVDILVTSLNHTSAVV